MPSRADALNNRTVPRSSGHTHGPQGPDTRGTRNGVFYPPRCPQRLWLDYYASHFDTVELKRDLLPAAAGRSRDALGRGDTVRFRVRRQGQRYLTHVKRAPRDRADLALLLERIEPLLRSSTLGSLLWQLPRTFHRDDERLAAALAAFPAGLPARSRVPPRKRVRAGRDGPLAGTECGTRDRR